jgi:lysophospholipase L1-like esterase
VAVFRLFVRLVAAGGLLVSSGLLVAAQQAAESTGVNTPPSDPRIVLLGRVDKTDPAAPRFGFPGSGWAIRFTGSSVTMGVDSNSATSALTLVLDGKQLPPEILQQGHNLFEVRAPATVWDSSQVAHTLQVHKRTETWQGVITFRGLTMGGSTLLSAPQLPRRRLMFVGDSVTCGTGVNYDATCKNPVTDPSSDAYDSYGMVLGRRLDAQAQLVCYGGRGLERDYRGLGVADGVLNAPQFLDLAIAIDDPKKTGALNPTWNAASYTPDAILVSLGTNDFNLQSTKPLDASQFVADYAALLKRLRAEYPQTVILGTEGAIVINPLLRQYIKQAVAKVHDPKILWTQSHHYPGNGCDPHPSREQHVHMAEDFEVVLREELGW